MTHPYALEIKKGRWSSAFFDTKGNETGAHCMAPVDGSVQPVDFKITAPADRFLYIHQLTGYLQVSTRLRDDGFGASNSPIARGLLLLEIDSTGAERVMTNQLPIRKNMDFAAYSPWTFLPNDATLSWRFQITDDGTPFRLRPRHSLVWRVRDDLTEHQLRLQCMHMRAGMVVVPSQYR